MSQPQPFAPSAHPAEASALAPQTGERLATLAAMTMDLAALVKTAAECLAAAAPPVTTAELLPPLVNSFTRLARSLRQTEAFTAKLATAAAASATAGAQAAQTRAYARRRILRSLENTIARRPESEHENLLADLYERLDDPVFEEDLALTQADTLIAQLRADLGLATDAVAPAPRRSAQTYAALANRAAAPPGTAPPKKVPPNFGTGPP